MQARSVSRIWTRAVPMMIVWGLLGTASSAWGQTTSGTCTDQILRGDYGFIIQGWVHPEVGVSVPLFGVAMTNFDGDGKLTQVDHVIAGGDPISPTQWTPATGTYHVNYDCTGTAQISVTSTGLVVNLRIVVVRHGEEVRFVVTPPFNGPKFTVTSIGTRRN